MRTSALKSPALRAVLASTVALSALSLAGAASAEENCRADGNNLAYDCTHYNAGTVVSRPVQPNVSNEASGPLGAAGFSISIDAETSKSQGATGETARRTIAGAPARPQHLREADRRLEAAGVDLSYDGLGARPRLALRTTDLRESFRAGESVTFRAASNYPAWIKSSEVVITDQTGELVAIVPIPANGEARWVMPEAEAFALSQDKEDGTYIYHLRVSDALGRRDETQRLFLTRVETGLPTDLTGPVHAAGEGDDMTARRAIPVAGGAITVSGQSLSGQPARVMGEAVPLDSAGKFVVQRILPPGTHAVAISVDGRALDRSVTIEKSEWFATGIADLTLGRSEGETWRLGRLAGFAQGTLADGTRLTASVDSEEEELRDLFRNFGRKNPDQTLRSLRAEDVFNTFGDDSQMSELAPTSGKVFLRAEKEGSYLQWGDFKPLEDQNLTVRSERALYGISGEYRDQAVTSEGESKLRVSGFAAQADSLMQRDVLRATGGSAYFLSRQDLLADSESLWIELRSRTTGLVVDRRRLSEGTDYRINAVQGVVILTSPLSPTARGEGLISDGPMGDYDVNLVAQYEYVPTTGEVDGYTAGTRAEAWVNDNLRLGASVLRETTGLADNELAGVDLLLRDGEDRALSFDYASSQGPGFGSNFSLNGGMDLEASDPSYGLPGRRADAWRIAGKTDLEALGLEGEIEGFYDRKEAGFTSPDDNIEYDQDAWGLSGRVALSMRSAVTFGAEGMRDDNGKREEKARLGFAHDFDQSWKLEGEIAHDARDASGSLDDFGTRKDAALRLTWARDADFSAWIFGQSTLSRDATRRQNDRIGAGFSTRLTERSTLLAEVSDGSLGGAGRLEWGYRPNDKTTTTIGYVLDPMRRFDTSGFSGQDRGTLVFSSTSEVNENWAYLTETNYSAFGTRPALTSGYGVTYTPSQSWQFDALVQYGESKEDDGSRLEREGLSLGLRYNEAEEVSAGLRGEWRRENSTRPDDALDRDTWLISGFYETSVSEDWRFVSALDAVVSDSDQSAFRDGRYVEARMGYAWRPVANDRINGLVSYTYLYDLPGADQVNIDGDLNGPRQKSHIVNAAVSWKANPVWTLGAKYGYRLRERAEREGNDFTRSEAHLAVLRADYHVVHNWDVMGELRGLWTPSSGTTETAVLLGAYRLVGDHIRIGGGYLWGEVSDDLRKVETAKEGFFLNITSQF